MARAHQNIDRPLGLRLVVAGGGTGGHLFPGIAVAQAFAARNTKNEVLFINAGRPLETSVLKRLGWPHQTIAIEGIKGRSRWQQLVATLKIPMAVSQSSQMLKSYGPQMVLGVGGYSAGPVVAAAWRRGIPTALHEQNQMPGVTNRLVGRMVDRIYLSFDESRDHFDGSKILVSGNPVRDEIIAMAGPSKAPKKDRPFNVLIVGGSQGAQAINQAMMDAMTRLDGKDVAVVHQTGEQDESKVKQVYAGLGIPTKVQAFFEDMAAEYQQADVIVCRAGATTVAEITVLGKAALFIPFPHATDDHQTKNAQALVEAGAAKMIAQKALNGKVLAETIEGFMNHRGKLAKMAARARALGRPSAAKAIVDDMYQLITARLAAA